ncbi:MAG: hypothetical protein ACI90V_008547, partial [Bacillariaceae sp.]|jgi:hypothetical protein
VFRDITIAVVFVAAVGIVAVVVDDIIADVGEIDTKEGTTTNADVAVNNSATDNICIRDTSSSSCFFIIVIVIVIAILFAVVASIFYSSLQINYCEQGLLVRKMK